MDKNKYKETFFKLLNTYPSPHNGQPIRIKEISDGSYELYFDKSRGLKSTEISYLFSFVSMGVFCEYASLCCNALGHRAEIVTILPSQSDLRGNGLIKFADLKITWNVNGSDETTLAALQFRQTSRKKYYTGTSGQADTHAISAAKDNGMQIVKLPKDIAQHAVWLNQRAVFDDIKDRAVREELDHWLRYTADQKVSTNDGLAYDCMELNGKAMKYIIDHHKILENQLIAKLLKTYYLRTMSDDSDVFYMLAPFKTEHDSFKVGTMVMRLWHIMSSYQLYIHPFGTIMSNQKAHADFVALADIKNESLESGYLVFIFRAGKSEKPTPSMRKPYDIHLIIKD